MRSAGKLFKVDYRSIVGKLFQRDQSKTIMCPQWKALRTTKTRTRKIQ